VPAQLHILVVDDEAWFRSIVRMYLESKGYRVSDTADAATGLETARRDVPDLILLDLTMPETDGWYALGQLKADPLLTDVPVVVLTASADESTEWRAKELGAVRYITKSVHLEDLLSTLNQILA
jgi:CheY-like chemotaxis protein